MPELPEVETVRRGLAARLTGSRIARIGLARGDLRWPIPPGFAEALQGRRILGFGRRGKTILMRLEGGLTVLWHLGMSGRLRLSAPDEAASPVPHEHVVIETEDGWRVGFVDPRRFGSLDLVPTAHEADHPRLAGLGPEPLDAAFTPAVLEAALAGRRCAIKAALMDQAVVAGLGNIYACEALFRAGISPKREARTVRGERAARLVAAIKATLEEAIAAGGSSLRDWRQTNGELGYFQHAWKVYGRAGEPCERCPGPPACRGIATMVQQGRTTFYCPRTQR
ncbi:bifunctional DNA-formamidopyrimidine glycosylase/DNA-(apurinic or apyrimidinic site) lyase [Elioraea thermophila]|uniref:bifunctional DNA-formamidopyrimidine glycosylase/DNA-(apurinic or apyrimidinic site) lyase n=1 Tax=Elioraea thermophila TaxID=2185104 RepID=UPI000DF3DBB0|nr:bifunctional DNA-formamidopyrimidine glycosylase/DNA-(apurinic or apyrimidinic site) lyase [Elioraea thermophila]